MLAVLGRLADVERDLIRTRTADGSHAKGQARGSAPSLTLAQQKEANRRHAQGATLARIGAQQRRRDIDYSPPRALPNLCLAPTPQSSRPTFPSEQC
jgi:hypothetical protein